MAQPVKTVYLFGGERTEGAAAMKNLLGGKGANLAEMCRLGITVPVGLHHQHRGLHRVHRAGQRRRAGS